MSSSFVLNHPATGDICADNLLYKTMTYNWQMFYGGKLPFEGAEELKAELLTSDEHIDRFMGPAGLTGLWQVEKRGEAGKLSAEERKQLDITYAKTFSFWLDIKIILKTVTAFIQKENV